MRSSKAAVALILVALCAASALAAEKIVKLSTGGEVRGEVSQVNGKYRIKTKSGAVMEFPADQVVSVTDAPDPKAEYLQRRAKIDANSPTDHMALAEWALGNKLLLAAKAELQQALKLKPDLEAAQILLRQVEAQIAAATENPSGTEPNAPSVAEMLVSQADIYQIRLMELRNTDVVPVKFQNDVVERFIREMQGEDDFKQPNADKAFRALSSIEKVRYMLKHRPDDAKLREDIHVESDPAFMKEFRSTVWPVVSQFCGQSRCHGGAKPVGGFWLVSGGGASSERVDYTNFLIVDGLKVGSRRLVDRDNPKDSLLLNYGLPPEQARYKHPAVSPRPFRNRESTNYRRVIDWIQSLATQRINGPLRPEYKLQWKPPFGMNVVNKHAPFIPGGATEPADANQPKLPF